MLNNFQPGELLKYKKECFPRYSVKNNFALLIKVLDENVPPIIKRCKILFIDHNDKPIKNWKYIDRLEKLCE